MGGGGSKAKTETTSVSKALTNYIMQSITRCPISVIQSQEIRVAGAGAVVSGARFSQAATISANCAAQALSRLDATAAATSAVKAVVDSTAGGMSMGDVAVSKAVSDVANIIRTTITNQSIMECIASVNQSQTLIVEASAQNARVTNSTLEQTADLYAKCIQDTLAEAGVDMVLDTSVDQAATAELKNPVTEAINTIGDVIGDSFAALMNSAMIVYLGMLIAFIFVAYMFGGQIIASIFPSAAPAPAAPAPAPPAAQ